MEWRIFQMRIQNVLHTIFRLLFHLFTIHFAMNKKTQHQFSTGLHPTAKKFIWSEPAKLVEVKNTPKYIELCFGDIQSAVKMSKFRYQETARKMYEKALSLEGEMILYRTSQNTASWSPSEWFSELKAAD